MKLWNPLVVVGLLVCFGCAEHTPIKKQQVQFELAIVSTDANAGGRVQSPAEIPPGAKLRMSLKTSEDAEVFEMQDFELLRVGNSVISPAIELTPGSYKITDFMIVSVGDEVLFATPRSGSPLSQFVSNPLDVLFSVASGMSNKIAMEVMDVSENLPEDFGYVSFNLNVVYPFSIAVFAGTEEGAELTAAELILEKGEFTVQSESLLPQVNKFAFSQAPDEILTMRISKPGYLAYTREFTYNEIKSELSEGPLKVTLMPGMTIVTPFYNEHNNNLDFWISGSGLTVDWGDGVIEQGVAGSHLYAPNKRYVIHITGDLASVTGLGGVYNDANFHEIDFTKLTNLQNLDFTIVLTPKRVDLSMCTSLHNLTFFECRGTEELILPRSPNLYYVSVSGSQLNSEAINSVIERVYSNAREFEMIGGEFRFIRNTFGTDDMTILAGPPDEDALQKLRELRDVYGWMIEPAEY